MSAKVQNESKCNKLAHGHNVGCVDMKSKKKNKYLSQVSTFICRFDTHSVQRTNAIHFYLGDVL